MFELSFYEGCVRAVSSFAPSKGIQESLGFWIPRHEFWIPGTRFRIPIVSGFLEQYSIFQSPGFWIPQAKISWIPESVFPYMGRLVHPGI